jgi:hypothetical protein
MRQQDERRPEAGGKHSKSECQNPKQIQITKIRMFKTVQQEPFRAMTP